jgi:hypothetical protein
MGQHRRSNTAGAKLQGYQGVRRGSQSSTAAACNCSASKGFSLVSPGPTSIADRRHAYFGVELGSPSRCRHATRVQVNPGCLMHSRHRGTGYRPDLYGPGGEHGRRGRHCTKYSSHLGSSTVPNTAGSKHPPQCQPIGIPRDGSSAGSWARDRRRSRSCWRRARTRCRSCVRTLSHPCRRRR